jgi:uncharacterized protein YlxW (UPF0749 family)
MLGEASTIAITIITISFFAILVLAGILVARVVRDPDKAIGARTRKRWEEHEDARRLEEERRRLERERRLSEEQDRTDGTDDPGRSDGTDRSDDADPTDQEDGTHE